MNFFRSVLSEDSDPPKPETAQDMESESPLKRNQDPEDVDHDADNISPPPKSPHSDSSSGGSSIGGGGWSFGGLIKTIATQSESVLETYRRDLREFGSGLRKESEIIREVANRAVKDLPASLEAGASAAHGSLESVGLALDGVLKSTADIISHGKETLLLGSDGESETPDINKSFSSGRYSRFDAQLNAIQSDVNTFSKDPEDLEEYQKWKSGFTLMEKSNEFEGLIGENGLLESLYKRLVPNNVDHETFWSRYYYKVHKLKQQESVRANLVKRAISVDDEEELSWDVDEEEEDGWEQKGKAKAEHKDESRNEDSNDKNLSQVEKQEDPSNELQNKEEGDFSIVDNVEMNNVFDSSKNSSDNVSSDEKAKSQEIIEVKDDEKVESEKIAEEKNDEKVKSNGKVDEEAKGEKNGAGEEITILSHPSVAEEDLEWDEIEDIESHDDENKINTTHGGSPNRAELRNRLSIAEEDEDLNWDIEDDDDDDERVKD